MNPVQEDHLEEYREEVRATSLTIDQFLMGKDFAIRDDLLISLEHLQVCETRRFLGSYVDMVCTPAQFVAKMCMSYTVGDGI